MSCFTYDSTLLVIGRAQSNTFSTPLVLGYTRPALEKSMLLYGHTKGVTCLALGQEVVVSGSCDQSVRVWGRENGEILSVILNHRDIVTGNILC